MQDRPGEVSLLASLTLAIWIICLAIGATGVFSRPTPPPPPVTQPAAPIVETIDTKLFTIAPTIAVASASPSPAAAQPLAPPSAPAVAAPSPLLAFAVPTPGIVRLVQPSEAGDARARPEEIATASRIFKQQEASQPPPSYPTEAQLAGEVGSVVIDFMIDRDGRIVEAHIANASPWPLLNIAALDCVRDTWRFPPGPAHPGSWTFNFEPHQ